MKILQRKSSLRCWKSDTCHAKSRGAQSVLVRREASADIYGDTENTTPAKSGLRCWKCHTCHAKSRCAQSSFVAKLPLEILKVARPPRKSSLRCWKCHVCHAKSRGAHQSCALLIRRQASADIYMEIPKVPHLPRKSSLDEVLKAPRLPCKKPWRPISPSPSSSPSFRGHLWNILPCKSSLRCWKRHTCHAKSRGAQSVLVRRQASADIDYGNTESTTPATQIEPDLLKGSRLPLKKPRGPISPIVRRQASADVYGDSKKKAPRLPRKSGLRCWKGCHACHAKSCGAQSVLVRRQASADIYYRDTESTTPRGHACRAKSYGAESVLVRRQGSKPLAWHLGVSNVFGCFKLAWPLAQIPPTHPLKSWGG